MTGGTGLPVSARAWSELLHAEVAARLGRAGVPVLHLKGPTVVLWLYGEGERPWGDVDVLVPPGRMDEALALLGDAGLVEVFAGVNRHTTTDHAVTVGRRETGGLLSEVDVHDRFPGIDADPGRAFDLLWARREPARLGHVDVWFPDLATRALLVALNTARSGSAQARGDLARLVAAAAPADWEAVISLGRAVSALPALRAGLECDPAGREVVASTALTDVAVSAEWRLRLAGAPRTALRLEELVRLPWRERLRMLRHWVAPPAPLVRMRDPAAGAGPGALAAAYARRLGDGLRDLPVAARAVLVETRRRRRSARARRGGVRESSS